MSLFKFNEIEIKEDNEVFAINEDILNESSTQEGIFEIIELLKHNQLVSFLTNGKWSIHQLIVAIFLAYGKGKISFCTWGLSEPPLRALLSLKEKGYLIHIQAILDHRIRERQPKAFQLFLGIADNYGLAKSHAKGYFIEIDQHKFSILISANLNRNTKNEFGCIINGKNTFDLYQKWIINHLQKNKD